MYLLRYLFFELRALHFTARAFSQAKTTSQTPFPAFRPELLRAQRGRFVVWVSDLHWKNLENQIGAWTLQKYHKVTQCCTSAEVPGRDFVRGKTHDLTQFLFHRFVWKRKIQSSDKSSAVRKACSQVGRMDFQTKQYDYFAMRKKKPNNLFFSVWYRMLRRTGAGWFQGLFLLPIPELYICLYGSRVTNLLVILWLLQYQATLERNWEPAGTRNQEDAQNSEQRWQPNGEEIVLAQPGA